MNHDIRTPLNAILGMVELLEETNVDERQREYISVLRRNTEKLLAVAGNTTEAAQPNTMPTGLRILVADDTDDNRYLIARYLRDTASTVDEAANGQEAFDKFRLGEYDFVLMDIEMPIMDGFDATRAIRSWERDNNRRRTRILALTAHDPSETRHAVEAAGCDELLTKPIRKATLLAALTHQTPDVADLVPGYLMRRRAELPILRAALDAADLDALRIAGHKLSGTGGGYGLPRISEIGAAIESAAKARDAAPIGALIDSLEETIRE